MRKVLVVDDNPDDRHLFVWALKKAGYIVCAVHSAEVAFAIWPEFDLVVTDNDMPETSGADFSKRIKATKPSCPVILMTGAEGGGAIVHRADRFWMKNVDTSQLILFARELLGE